MIVVSDTSPIRAINFLGLLPILNELFERVLIPPAVKLELDTPLPRFDRVDVSRYEFIAVQSPQDQNQVALFLRVLDRGESEAIALALETGTKLILVDERRGRAIAAQHGIVALGALGVLLRAKSHGIIPLIRPLIEKLDELEFYMSTELKENVLKLAGE